MRRFLAVLAFLGVSLIPLKAASTLFEGARLIVDPRKPPMEDAALLIENGRVTQIGRKGKISAPPGSNRVDATGQTIIPALIDPHVHLGFQKDGSYAVENFTRENVIDQLNRYAYAGVSAVMSLGTDINGVELQVRDQQASPVILRTAGRGFSAPNAGPGTPAMRGASIGITTEEEARKGVREQLAHKVDIIKIWVDDRNGTVKKLEPALYRAVIDEAHKGGARAIAHVYYLDDAKELLRAGIDGFAHLVRDKEFDDEAVALIKQRKVFVMPNLGIAEMRTHAQPPSWLDEPLYRAVTPTVIRERVKASFSEKTAEAAQKTYTIMEHNLAKLNSAGITIGFGADSGAVPDYFHAFNTQRELQLMVSAGMTPAQALTSVTVTSAAFLKLADKGTLEKGKRADLLVLDGNPLEDISNTRKIARVFLKGEELNRDAVLPK